MRSLLCLLTLSTAALAQSPSPTFDAHAAERFAKLALACVHLEYPNKISHTMSSDADAAPPRKLTPAFYGCYDWHSSVHGHWLLARLARTYPDATFTPAARAALQQSITADNVAAEVKYLKTPGRASFERPYGLAWLLQLSAELREWGERPTTEGRRPGESQSGKGAEATNDPEARKLAEILRPLELAAVARLKVWLPKLSYPIRSGEHSQTAFALGLMIDYARGAGDAEFEKLLVAKAREFYEKDVNCPLSYEPSGEDFLSPCLAEADVMRRVLARNEYNRWLRAFFPGLFATAGTSKITHPSPKAGEGWGNPSALWMEPAVVTDPSDPKLAHLDGLNLSRAWMLDGIFEAVQPDPKSSHIPDYYFRLSDAAKAHRNAGLASVTGEHYEGGHWLGSFAVYLVTRRGINEPNAAKAAMP